jgi:hypothetical protein
MIDENIPEKWGSNQALRRPRSAIVNVTVAETSIVEQILNVFVEVKTLSSAPAVKPLCDSVG